jgi:hypothetical protein
MKPRKTKKTFKKGVQIFQKGGCKKDHDTLLKATQFYAKELMTTRMFNSLAIRIEMRASKLNKFTRGTCSMGKWGSQTEKKYVITIKRDMSIGEKLEVLAHEMVHVQQRAYNRIQMRRWKSDYNQIHVRFDGEEMGRYHEMPYLERPWEIEAMKQQKPLAEAFVKNKPTLKKALKEYYIMLKSA